MDKQMYFGLATLILGWLLGIFSNIILNRSKRKSTKNDVEKGIRAELSELQMHLASVSLLSICGSGLFDKEYFNWVKPHFIKSFRSVESIFPKNVMESLPDISTLSDDELFALLNATFAKKTTDSEPVTFTYQKISIPFVDSKINMLSLLENEAQQLILVIKRDINFLNNDIDQIWTFHQKTFEVENPVNHERLRMNIHNISSRIGKRSKTAVDKIVRLVKLLDN